MNDDHICTIAEKLQEVLEGVDGLAAVNLEAFDVTNPPANYEANIQLLMVSNDPIGGAVESDGFGPARKIPAIDRYRRGIMVEIVKRGTNWIGIQNMAARCYSAIANSEELAALVDFIEFDGDVPSHADADSNPFVSVALVFVFGYSTEAGHPGRRIHA